MSKESRSLSLGGDCEVSDIIIMISPRNEGLVTRLGVDGMEIVSQPKVSDYREMYKGNDPKPVRYFEKDHYFT